MIINLKDMDMNNYISWVYSTLLQRLQTAETSVEAAYSLGVPSGTVALNTDLNDYIEAGEYMCVGTNAATTITNTPTTYNFKLIVEYVTGGFIQQTVIARDGKKWMRTYTISSATWGDWLCGSLDNIADITMDNNGRLIVTRADGTKATYNPDTII